MFARQVCSNLLVPALAPLRLSVGGFPHLWEKEAEGLCSKSQREQTSQSARLETRSWLWDLPVSFGPSFSPSKPSSDHCISVPSKHVTFDLFLLEMLLFSYPTVAFNLAIQSIYIDTGLGFRACIITNEKINLTSSLAGHFKYFFSKPRCFLVIGVT